MNTYTKEEILATKTDKHQRKLLEEVLKDGVYTTTYDLCETLGIDYGDLEVVDLEDMMYDYCKEHCDIDGRKAIYRVSAPSYDEYAEDYVEDYEIIEHKEAFDFLFENARFCYDLDNSFALLLIEDKKLTVIPAFQGVYDDLFYSFTEIIEKSDYYKAKDEFEYDYGECRMLTAEVDLSYIYKVEDEYTEKTQKEVDKYTERFFDIDKGEEL